MEACKKTFSKVIDTLWSIRAFSRKEVFGWAKIRIFCCPKLEWTLQKRLLSSRSLDNVVRP